MQIDHLRNHPDALATLAEDCAREWGHLYANWNLAAAQREFAETRTDGGLPVTLVALEGDTMLGTVSLIFDDLPGFEHLNPWLASLLVKPDRRGRGGGVFLVREAEALFRKNGFSTAYLFTETAGGFFEKLGWRIFEPVRSNGHPVTIYAKDVAGSQTVT